MLGRSVIYLLIFVDYYVFECVAYGACRSAKGKIKNLILKKLHVEASYFASRIPKQTTFIWSLQNWLL